MIRTPYSPLVETCNITAYSLLVFLFSSSGYRLSSVLASPLNPTCLLGYCSICSRGTQLKLQARRNLTSLHLLRTPTDLFVIREKRVSSVISSARSVIET